MKAKVTCAVIWKCQQNSEVGEISNGGETEERSMTSEDPLYEEGYTGYNGSWVILEIRTETTQEGSPDPDFIHIF